MSTAPAGTVPPVAPSPRRGRRYGVSLAARGEPALWLGGGALAVCLLMIAGLFSLILWQGLATFWPGPVLQFETRDGGVYMGEVTRRESYQPPPAQGEGLRERRLIRTGNYRLTQVHFQWVDADDIASTSRPAWAMVVERLEWGRFYGSLRGLAVIDPLRGPDHSEDAVRRQMASLQGDGRRRVAVRRFIAGHSQDLLVAVDALQSGDEILGVARAFTTPEDAWAAFAEDHPQVRERWRRRRHLEDVETGVVNRREERARLALRRAEMAVEEKPTPKAVETLAVRRLEFETARARAGEEFAAIRGRIAALDVENARYQLLLETAGEGNLPARSVFLPLDHVVRAAA